jgi:hypothetical protein
VLRTRARRVAQRNVGTVAQLAIGANTSGGTVAHVLAAGPVNLGMDSTFMEMSLALVLIATSSVRRVMG